MAYKIEWTPRAEESYDSNIAYLWQEWTEREILNFVNAVEKNYNLLLSSPNCLLKQIREKTFVKL